MAFSKFIFTFICSTCTVDNALLITYLSHSNLLEWPQSGC